MTVDEAAVALEKSARSVQRLIAGKVLDSKIETEFGRRVRRISAVSVLEMALAFPDNLAALFDRIVKQQQLAAELNEAATKRKAERATREKLWLTLDESAAYSGLSGPNLLALCQAEEITARGSGSGKIRRAGPEAFAG